jgi:hypothetical protein
MEVQEEHFGFLIKNWSEVTRVLIGKCVKLSEW